MAVDCFALHRAQPSLDRRRRHRMVEVAKGKPLKGVIRYERLVRKALAQHLGHLFELHASIFRAALMDDREPAIFPTDGRRRFSMRFRICALPVLGDTFEVARRNSHCLSLIGHDG